MGTFDHWASARRVCVIGAGTMGGGIAAHLANTGFEVTLLDLTSESVHEAFWRAKAARPPHFYLPETADSIRLGSIEEDLHWVREAEWVCEAIIEKMDAKRDLFEKIEPLLRPDAMLSTNTSGLQIGLLCEGRSESFRRRFMGTHFFNPPRFLKLLELIPTSDTDPDAVRAMAGFLEGPAARRVVVAKDTPGFIANRFGMWSMFQAIHAAERLHLSIEQVDAITGPFLGRPRSASFRLNDLVGLDIMQDIANNLLERCPDDPRKGTLATPRSMSALLERGWIGEKSGQGYYRREGKELLSLDLQTLAYRQRQEPDFASLKSFGKLPLAERVGAALDLKDEVGEFLREYLVPALRYADELKAEISHSAQDFDRVMKWGFAWGLGPFETIDAIGPERVGVAGGAFYSAGKQRGFGGKRIPVRREPEFARLDEFPITGETETLRLRDLGDGVTAVCLATKMGVVSPLLVCELLELLETSRLERIVLTSESKHFSAGFDRKFFIEKVEAEDFESIETALASLQKLSIRLGEIPSVAAIFGYCLGAGLELALGCGTIAAAAESQVGFPEAKVGLIPGGAGAARARLVHQARGSRYLSEVAHQISLGAVSSNVDEAAKRGLLRGTDVTVYHPDRLLSEAKRLALEATPLTLPEWRNPEGPLAGMIDRLQQEAKARGDLTAHDEVIGDKVKSVFAKSDSFENALERERQGFLELLHYGLTIARIRHMLETGKPMRN